MINQSDKMIVEKININPYFLHQYKTGCSNYTFEKCIRIISLLKQSDLKFKGITGAADSYFLKELVLRILF